MNLMVRLNRNLKALFLINIATSLSSSLIYPLFPLFLDGMGTTIENISLVLFVGGAAASVLLIPAGLLSDRFRRRNLLILSAVMSASAAFYLTTVTSWEYSILGMMLLLCSSSVFLPTRHTLIADNADSDSMTTVFSVMNVAWPIGSMIGPVLGGFLADSYGWNYAFYAATLASLLSIIPTLFFRRTYKGDKRLDKKKTEAGFFGRGFIIFLLVFVLFQIFASAAMGILDPVVPLYLTQTFYVDKTEVGFLFSMGTGVATLLAQVPSAMLANKYGRKKILACSILPLSFLMLLWPIMQSFSVVTVLYMFIGGLWSMTWPVAVSYLMTLTPTLQRGFVISLRQTAVRLGFTIGPLIGGYLWTAYEPKTPFYVSSAFFAASLLFIWLLKDSKSKKSPD
jgi:DHA1 family multidrug resistance protein-like MFS transporter